MATVPTAPGTPSFSLITPTTVKVSWTASSSNGGSAITTYKLRRSISPLDSPYVDGDALNLTRNVTGLVPGTAYRFKVYAGNAIGWSPASTVATLTMPGVIWVRYGGKWHVVVPYVRDGGVWKMAIPYVRYSGTWHATG
jgi:Fibronectin type III domain